jgi:ABC-type multidrug transport system fused ATPase/permease subunit
MKPTMDCEGLQARRGSRLIRSILLQALLSFYCLNHCAAFVVPVRIPQSTPFKGLTQRAQWEEAQSEERTPTALSAIKKKLSAAASAAFVAIEEQKEKFDDDESKPQALSKKELKKALSKKSGEIDKIEEISTKKSKADLLAEALQNEASLSIGEEDSHVNGGTAGESAPSVDGKKNGISKKDLMLQKALELEQADVARAQQTSASADEPILSAKELKALKKKEEKMAAKLEKKKAKKMGNLDDVEEGSESDDKSSDIDELTIGDVSGTDLPGEVMGEATVGAEVVAEEVTLEDKIRKERPPPRIRVMESVQAGYVSIRMENVGIIFRNQQVLKDVTWGVQNGDRIGLVGANGAGTLQYISVICVCEYANDTDIVVYFR